jgi:nicotinamidase-related amidase
MVNGGNMKFLVVVDVQNDFVTGTLANSEAQAKIPLIKKKIQQRLDEGWQVVFTQDTHFDDYYDKTMEGKYLPTKHCLAETAGWHIVPELEEFLEASQRLLKSRFGDIELYHRLVLCMPEKLLEKEPIEEIELIGFCTDICVVSNALILKAASWSEKTIISCDASCCAGTSAEAHEAALIVMRSCQVEVH